MDKDKRLVVEKIKEVIKAKGGMLDEAAKKIAPNFDYEQAKIETKIEEIMAANPDFLEDAAKKIEDHPIEAASEEIQEDTKEENKKKERPEPEYKEPWSMGIERRFFALNPRTSIGKFFCKDRHNAVLGVVILLALLVVAIDGLKYAFAQSVTVKYITFAGTKTQQVVTRSEDPETIAKESDFNLSKHYFVSPCEGTKVKNGDTVTVMEAVKATVRIGGNEVEFWLVPGTVKDNFAMNDITYTEIDRITPGLDEQVAADTMIILDRVVTETKVKKEAEQPKNYVLLDPSMQSGKQEITEGKAGEGYFTYTTTYVNGVLEGTTRTVKKWIKEPVDNTLKLGTSLTGHAGKYLATRTFTANTTAYYMGESARGAAGGRCVYGTCAVDPSIIPYGTLIWVEGYGAAVANDCGSGIKGDDLDLWMHSYEESCQWGRRFVTSYVLTPIE